MPIPLKIREELAEDPRMEVCMLKGHGECGGELQWHHAWTYKNRQIQESFAIGGLCENHHHEVDRRQCQGILLARLSDEYIMQIQKKYPKIDWAKEKKLLENQFNN